MQPRTPATSATTSTIAAAAIAKRLRPTARTRFVAASEKANRSSEPCASHECRLPVPGRLERRRPELIGSRASCTPCVSRPADASPRMRALRSSSLLRARSRASSSPIRASRFKSLFWLVYSLSENRGISNRPIQERASSRRGSENKRGCHHGRYENPNIDALSEIARGLGVSIRDLFQYALSVKSFPCRKTTAPPLNQD